MKRIFLKLVICVGLFNPLFSYGSGVWKEISPEQAPREWQLIHPDQFKVFRLDEATLKLQFWNLSTDPEAAQIIAIPMPDGSTREFRVWETPMLPPDLALQEPDIKTFTGTAVDDPTVTAKLDFTLYGFHSMVFDGENTSFIDPYDNFHDGYYTAYYKRDLRQLDDVKMNCGQHTNDEFGPGGEPQMLTATGLPKLAYKTINGYQLRTYRLALACSSQYAIRVTSPATPTKPAVLSKMTTTMNRVNGVYEREFSITMVFVSSEDNVIFLSSVGDPYFSINSNPSALLSANQIQCNNLIGFTNYDIGHVFATGDGGIASLGCVCTFSKAQGTTGRSNPTGDAFDIDYVAHEMGHQFGAQHTFNNNAAGSCGGGNAEMTSAYEPGSGSTIMAYAGLCAPDNVQFNSDPYFHARSVGQIITFVEGIGNCAAKTATSNKLVKYDAFSPTTYNIPYLTPFELTAPPAVDSAGDSVVLYGWEQYDLGSFGSTWAATTSSGPIFRSFNPSKSNVRVFPKISLVLAGNLSSAYEKAPTVARDMKFKCLYHNIRNNKGCVTIPDEVITVKATTTGTGAGFKVTSQDAAGTIYTGGSSQTVTWDVLNTTAAPISTARVDIWMSINGGNSWQYFVGNFPNSGSATVVVPNPATNSTTTRFKVKGAGNVFFNVNKTNFTVNYNSAVPISPNGVTPVSVAENVINVFPIPADNMLHITSEARVVASIYNVVGQMVWQGGIDRRSDINVAEWAAGAYFIRFVEEATGKTSVKEVIIQ